MRKKSGNGSCFQKVKSFEYHVIKPTKDIYYKEEPLHVYLQQNDVMTVLHWEDSCRKEERLEKNVYLVK